jgi:xanthine dehydrogenase YagS FAD-binding subunit
VAQHPDVRRLLPGLAAAIEASASPQIRAMGTLGGNLLQRTRCPFFRLEPWVPCNKRTLGSGCTAQDSDPSYGTIVGSGDQCVATHPSDPAVMLAALDASVTMRRVDRSRDVPIADFYRHDVDDATRDHVLEPGELITAITVPLQGFATNYIKLRTRASFDFALVSAAVALRFEGRSIGEARIALGGVGPGPWRITEAERALVGKALDRAVVEPLIERALHGQLLPLLPAERRFKVDLAVRVATRGLLDLGGEA